MGAPKFEVLHPWFDRALIEDMIHHTGSELLEHAEADYPNECVGLIWSDYSTTRLINQARSPERFSISGPQFTEAVLEAPDHLDLVAIYHSHPGGNREFSASDVEAFMEQRRDGYPFAWILVTPDGYTNVMMSRGDKLTHTSTFSVLIDQYEGFDVW